VVERLEKVRYLVIAGSLIACFINVVDELNKGSSLWSILFHSGTLLIIAIILIFSQNKNVLIGIFYAAGILMLIGDLTPGAISPSLMLFSYALYLSGNMYLKYITYLVVSLIVTASHVYQECSPDDIVNVLVGYAVFFALNELIYKKRQSDVETGG
jgi:hypothetical protein